MIRKTVTQKHTSSEKNTIPHQKTGLGAISHDEADNMSLSKAFRPKELTKITDSIKTLENKTQTTIPTPLKKEKKTVSFQDSANTKIEIPNEKNNKTTKVIVPLTEFSPIGDHIVKLKREEIEACTLIQKINFLEKNRENGYSVNLLNKKKQTDIKKLLLTNRYELAEFKGMSKIPESLIKTRYYPGNYIIHHIKYNTDLTKQALDKLKHNPHEKQRDQWITDVMKDIQKDIMHQVNHLKNRDKKIREFFLVKEDVINKMADTCSGQDDSLFTRKPKTYQKLPNTAEILESLKENTIKQEKNKEKRAALENMSDSIAELHAEHVLLFMEYQTPKLSQLHDYEAQLTEQEENDIKSSFLEDFSASIEKMLTEFHNQEKSSDIQEISQEFEDTLSQVIAHMKSSQGKSDEIMFTIAEVLRAVESHLLKIEEEIEKSLSFISDKGRTDASTEKLTNTLQNESKYGDYRAGYDQKIKGAQNKLKMIKISPERANQIKSTLEELASRIEYSQEDYQEKRATKKVILSEYKKLTTAINDLEKMMETTDKTSL